MPVISIDTADYRLRACHAPAAPAVLRTSARGWEGLPAVLREAGTHVWLGCAPGQDGSDGGDGHEPPPGGTGWMVSPAGERWLQGTCAQVRAALRVPGRRYFIPVHYPYWSALGVDLDLIGLQPRLFSATLPGQDSRQDCVEPRLRTAAAAGAQVAPGGQAWAQLGAALALEAAHPGAGLPQLALLAQDAAWHPLLRQLCLRNLVIALARRDSWAAAGGLLGQARALFPDYRELDFLAALRALRMAEPGEALAALRRATAPDAPLSVGSGGESGYRAHYLLAILAEQTGNQAVAHHHFLTGVNATPAFPASVAGLLRQRLPSAHLDGAQAALNRLARRQPEYQLPIFEFLLLHHAWELAERALRTWPLPGTVEATLVARWQATAPLRHGQPRVPGAPRGLVLAGPMQMYSSVARINQQLAAALAAEPGVDLALAPTAAAEQPLMAFPGHEAWAPALHRLPARLDLTLRHGWPPDFSRPDAGKLALILPWELGAIPRSWQRGLQQVDLVIVPSAFVRDVLIRAGTAAERIAVIPNGVDLARYCPEGEREAIAGSRGVKFLFVGGAIARKGIDVLLTAWRQAFTAHDDVSLVIKDLGARSFYRHLSQRDAIAALACDPGAAPIIYLDEDWPEARLPGLYRAADALVLPYRGEGFGLPLAEALACGTPVITTASGPAREFCAAGWFIPAAEVEVPPALRPPGPMSGPLTWFEPDLDALIAALRHATSSAVERQRRGALGMETIRRHYGWDTITRLYLAAVGSSLERPRAERAYPAASRSPATGRPAGATQEKGGRATSQLTGEKP